MPKFCILLPRLLHKATINMRDARLCFMFYLRNGVFREWAMLGSNQRPLPCECSVIVCWGFLELAKFLQMHRFFTFLSQQFRRFARVVAQLLLWVCEPIGKLSPPEQRPRDAA
jgi:hypothetical protein